MRYKFPQIEHIDDILPVIEGRDEFIVAKREWGFVVNYMVNMSDTFPPVDESPELENDILAKHNAMRRECRGILFYPDGKIMARRLHKFFNVNERDETQHHLIDLSKPHVILEKLDGSMITPVVLSWVPEETMPNFGGDPAEQVMRVNEMRWGTKMGITDVSAGAEEFVKNNPNYDKFARWAMGLGFTPIFEWCSRKQKIVVDYPEDRLVLIATRYTVSGEYMSLNWMHHYGDMFGVEVVKTYSGTTSSMEHLLSETRDVEGQEGWIIRFNDGHMVKVKGDWYVRLHKTKDSLTMEKNVVDLIVNEKIDDTKAFMLDEDRKRVDSFEDQFWKGFNNEVQSMRNKFNECVSRSEGDRKKFAIEIAPSLDSITRSIVFSCWDGQRDVRSEMLAVIRKNTGTQTKIDHVRHLWGGTQWTYHFDGDT